MLHGPDHPDALLHRGLAEVEAESVALMVAAAHGLDTSSYTIPYVASWASNVPGKNPVEVVRATADRVRATAITILDALPTAQIGSGDPPGLDRSAEREPSPHPDALTQRSAHCTQPSGVGL